MPDTTIFEAETSDVAASEAAMSATAAAAIVHTPSGVIAHSGVLERLTALHPKLIDLKLDRVVRLLHRLGDPHLALTNVIHVSGTNGKGSTLAFIRAGLEAAGLSTNTYTSPHLVHFTERVRLADGPITETHLLDVLERCEQANGAEPITLFEITTAAAMLAFAENPADANLIEVGLGGRFDATNVFPAPAMTVITPVSLDHVDFLGHDVAKIAWEKAGILKNRRPGVVAGQSPEALTAIETVAAEVGAPIAVSGQDWRVEPAQDGADNPGGFTFIDGDTRFELPAPALAGAWQIGNAGAALAALNRLDGFDLTYEAARGAVLNVHWPARLQRLTCGPLVDALAGRALWLDGGHNAAAATALAETLATWPERPRLIVGMLATKDNATFFANLRAVADQVEIITGPGAAALPVDLLAEFARASGMAARTHSSLADGIAALAADGGSAPVLIVGSLYLAGAVLAENG